jgi:gliding motility-associated-like protein
MKISTPVNGIFLLLLLTIGMVDRAHAQAEPDPLVFNNGAMFYINGGINDSAVVWVDGTFTNNDSTIINLGKLIVKRDFINNAQCGGDNTFPLQLPGNHGMFDIYGDWENNGTFYAGQGKVRFFTNDTIFGDTIQGTSVTLFHDAQLMGDIRRIQEGFDAEIAADGTLELGVGEWATDFDVLRVYNTATGAIQRNTACHDCGFVSSLQDGHLSRSTAQDASYVFPVGSALDISPNQMKRYRPVYIKPVTSAADTFTVRFVNRDATINSLPISNVDTTICYVNPWWYHRINQTGGANATATIEFYADPFHPTLPDEDYNTVANWSAANNLWENTFNTASSILGPWDQVVTYDYGNYLTYPEDAYILGFNVPPPPVVSGDTALCASVATTYTVPENGSEYDFVVTGGTVVDQTDYSVTVIWNNDSLGAVYGSVDVLETIGNNINGGCTSLLQSYGVEIWPLPVANFTISTDSTLPGGIFIHDILGMVDSSLLTSEWYWDFGDGVTSTDSMPYHSYYETGTYDITLIVRSGLECLDTLVVPVNVVEGLIIPNVFTPNGDGWNDVFDVRTSAVGDYKLQIYNRWGNIVFENTSPLISWDGTTSAGVQAPAGTYFYVITNPTMLSGNAIEDNDNNFDTPPGGDFNKGWLQLIR